MVGEKDTILHEKEVEGAVREASQGGMNKAFWESVAFCDTPALNTPALKQTFEIWWCPSLLVVYNHKFKARPGYIV